MVSTDIYTSFIKTFFESYSEHVCYASFPKNSLKKLLCTLDKDVIVIDMQSDLTPLKPFMEIISRFKPSESLIEEKAYSLQKSTFLSYIKYGVAVERDDILVSIETYYEKFRIRKTVLELLKNIHNAKFVILNTQLISREAIDIMKELENIDMDSKFVFCFDTQSMETSSEAVTEFFSSLNNKKNFFAITELEYDSLINESENMINRENMDFDNLLNSLRNNRMFLSLEQACELSDWIASDINSFGYNSFQNRYLYMEMALCYFYADQTDTASLYLNYVMEGQYDDDLNIQALFYSCQVLMAKNASASALKYVKLVIEKLRNDKKSHYYAYAKMMEYVIWERSNSKTIIDDYNEAIDLLMSHGFYNNCIITMLAMPWSYVDDPKKFKEIFPKVDEAEILARKIDNQFSLSSACHWKGILYSKMGMQEKANRWYEECNQIRTKIGDISSIIKIRNGLSYEFLMMAKFKESYDLINGFVEMLTGLSEYTEVIITLQNVARALFFSHHFKEAYPLYSTIIHLLRVMDVEDSVYNSFMPEYNDILIYKSIIDFYNGEIIRAKINHYNIANSDRPMTKVDRPLVKLLESFINLYDNRIDDAIKNFDEVVARISEFGSFEDYRVVFICYEFSSLLEKYGYKKYADQYFYKGYKLALKRNMDYYTKGKKTGLKLSDYFSKIEKFDKLNISLSYIEEKVEKERLVNQLHGRLRDSQFLNKIMSFGTEMTGYKAYAGSVSQSIFDYTTAEAVLIAKKTNGTWEQLSSIFRSDIDVPSPREQERLLKKASQKSNLYVDNQKSWYIYDISKFDFKGLIFIVQNKATPFTQDELNVMNIAVTTIQSQLVMFTQNEYLVYMSSTDQLSQLKNRRALDEFIFLENEKLRRHNINGPQLEETVCFVDLDNFKFYNDNYGHEAGDIVIASFAKLLKKIFRKIDFICRFGGDEFIIMLPETNSRDAKKIILRLYKALELKNYFINEIEQELNVHVELAVEKRLNFSVGISSNFDSGDLFNLSEVMNKADHALYYSKQNGKGQVFVWNEIKDLLSENLESETSQK